MEETKGKKKQTKDGDQKEKSERMNERTNQSIKAPQGRFHKFCMKPTLEQSLPIYVLFISLHPPLFFHHVTFCLIIHALLSCGRGIITPFLYFTHINTRICVRVRKSI
ncbi:conserved hypothetical protein, unlikely [Trypanosoma brucei gambiense DAL972]|uniref:Uncharacterized protein n=1 Tax=Trypanosoma brucei gambiense (strain MHOM/CI/86/DAL972) TaxID=679716 RepID=C9ZYG7_TRYB9|nr:conserved hypothetical protein, unlikely [Trypanosoma brucei gambiense DAL972]CBH14466.1 conserved hypothetical protein, unlikely [Trypanosoma brucei gambiense DAL972]|eukprot:XP_011776732.1 conserved hypothetical protein, unlikely [Trypanosoma brucei gambiense DAL972]